MSALALEPFVTGRQPHSRAVELHDVDADCTLLPPGAAATLTHDEGGLCSHLSSGPGWTLFAMRRRGRTATVRVCAETDALFADPAYLLSVALGDSRPDTSLRWRLLVLEDCDELVRAEAKRGTGQALSRLLNLTDGLLGQGLDVLVCLTTNEDVARLHPAVVRPGRCLAEIEVGPLSPEEARCWLADRHAVISGDGATLAELYQLRGRLNKVAHSTRPATVGNYL